MNLNRQGFEAYLPCYRKTRRHARRVDMVNRPLFPGYLFVRFDVERDLWRCIRSTVGVNAIVSFGGELSPVTPSIVSGLKAREDESGAISLRPSSLKVGDSVRVAEGPFEDHICLVDQIDDQKRVALLLNLMGRSVRVWADVEKIAAA